MMGIIIIIISMGIGSTGVAKHHSACKSATAATKENNGNEKRFSKDTGINDPQTPNPSSPSIKTVPIDRPPKRTPSNAGLRQSAASLPKDAGQRSTLHPRDLLLPAAQRAESCLAHVGSQLSWPRLESQLGPSWLFRSPDFQWTALDLAVSCCWVPNPFPERTAALGIAGSLNPWEALGSPFLSHW